MRGRKPEVNPAGRRRSMAVKVGNATIGGGAPVTIQSMTNTRTADTASTLAQIRRLVEAGCELVRVAVPDEASAAALAQLVEGSTVPLIADIHFDAGLAHLALENGAAKVRINPGNLGGKERLIELARKAAGLGAALRIGVNAGSLEKKLLSKYGGATARAMVESALGSLDVLEKARFSDIVVSLKASDVVTTIEAYRLIADRIPYPLHLGVTGAGPRWIGTIKGSVGIGTLLAEGIGDTIRVSLTADPVEEVYVARQILQVLRLREFGPELISCPTCGRCEIDLVNLAEKAEAMLAGYSRPVKVAVMGCVVNGPGEAREADLGISAGKKHGIVFRGGKVVRTVHPEQILEALREELDRFFAE